jgi:hypothetical protein
MSLPPLTAVLQRGAIIGAAPASAVILRPSILIPVNVGEFVDATIRYYAANVEQGIGNARPLLQRNVPEVVANIGDLDAEALLTHVGSGNGFVTTWYDQSGNGRNAAQTTANLQPQIVSNGAIETQNGKPAIRLQTSQLGITGIASFTSGYVGAVASVAAADANAPVVLHSTTGGLNAYLGFANGGSSVAFRMRNPDPAFTTPPSPYTVSNPINTNTLMSYTVDGIANINNYVNGALVWQDTLATSLNTVIGIGGRHGPQTITNGKVQEVVIFNTTFSTAARQTLERNQGAYYGITVT